MRVLMVGCGAVGQVFGYYLQKAGVELGFYAQPESAERLRSALDQEGLPVFQISHSNKGGPVTHQLKDYQVITDTAGSQAFEPDQIWITTPSTVLYTPWYREFLKEVPSKRVVCFPPEGAQPEFYPDGGDNNRMVFGLIMLLAWQGDLYGGGGLPGTVNFWLPPLTKIPLVGEENACKEVADLLRNGGLRSEVKSILKDKPNSSPDGLMSSFVSGLDLAGWSFRAYRRSPWMKIAAISAREAAAIYRKTNFSLSRIVSNVIASPTSFYLATIFLPLFFPFNMEKYLKFHFTKIREQTLSSMERDIKVGVGRGKRVGNLEVLLKGRQNIG